MLVFHIRAANRQGHIFTKARTETACAALRMLAALGDTVPTVPAFVFRDLAVGVIHVTEPLTRDKARVDYPLAWVFAVEYGPFRVRELDPTAAGILWPRGHKRPGLDIQRPVPGCYEVKHTRVTQPPLPGVQATGCS